MSEGGAVPARREVTVDVVDMPACELGEGARLLPDGLHQVDLLAGRLLAHREGGLEVVLDLDVPLGAAAPRAGGGLAVAAGVGVRLYASAGDPSPTLIDTGEDPDQVRVNDAVADQHGRLWFGLMRWDKAAGGGSLWRLDPDLRLTRVRDDVTIPNGPAVDAARGVLYLADSTRGVIHRHRLDPVTGELSDAEPFARLDDASPDGMALDAEGGLWSALWGGARLHRYAPDGTLTDVVPLPVDQPTSLALDPAGGPALVTSAWAEHPSPSPDDGRSLLVDLGARGAPAHAFAG